MRVIMFQEHEAKALVDKMKLESLSTDLPLFSTEKIEQWQALPESFKKSFIEEIHKKFHYEIVKWFQDQGVRFH